MSYELLVLPDRDDIDLEVLQKLERLVQDGATIVGRKPVRATGLADHQRRSLQVRQLAEKLWGPCDGTGVKEHAYGQGRVIWGRTLREVFQDRGIGPDFGFKGRDAETELDYIHRRTPDADIYFVINKGRRWDAADCTFRVHGRQPEALDARYRRDPRAACFPPRGRRHRKCPCGFRPAGSVFVVFRGPAAGDAITAVRHNDRPVLPISGTSSRGSRSVRIAVGAGRRRRAAGVAARQVHASDFARRGQDGRGAGRPAAPGDRRSLGSAFSRRMGRPGVEGLPEADFLDRPWDDLKSVYDEEGIQYFSGIATYHKEFDVPPDRLNASVRLVLDLGRVEKVAQVTLNGRLLGVLWKPPLQIDITEAAAGGRNRLLVAVANTWSNRLAGDARAKDGNRYCRTNIDASLTGKVPWKETPLRRFRPARPSANPLRQTRNHPAVRQARRRPLGSLRIAYPRAADRCGRAAAGP